jgi:hypothetical protein
MREICTYGSVRGWRGDAIPTGPVRMAVGRLRFPLGDRDRPEIGFVPSQWQMAGLRLPFGAEDTSEIGFLRKYTSNLAESAGYDGRRTVGRTPSSAPDPLVRQTSADTADEGVGRSPGGPPQHGNWVCSVIFIRVGEQSAAHRCFVPSTG